jgi:hypothetical protein
MPRADDDALTDTALQCFHDLKIMLPSVYGVFNRTDAGRIPRVRFEARSPLKIQVGPVAFKRKS